MLNRASLRRYIRERFPDAICIKIEKLGEGVQGVGFLVDVKTPGGYSSYVIKGLFPNGLGHDYPSDRAGVFLLDLDEFKNLPNHVRAIDVIADCGHGVMKSIGGGKEYYLLMERASGIDYFHDLKEMADKETLDKTDIDKIKTMTSYLARIHSVKKESKTLYWRKIRDTIGHGECLMGVFDTYPDGTIGYTEMAEIERMCIDWRAKLKPKYKRLCQIHGDFHPGNIWFSNNTDLVLLDRSRGPWGDAADDITALTINYIFFSVNRFHRLQGPYKEALRLFYQEYIRLTGDEELLSVVAPFYAFRGVVVANPIFYPDVTRADRMRLLNLVKNVLRSKRFNPDKVNEYLGIG